MANEQVNIEPTHEHAIRLSNRQYGQLRHIAAAKGARIAIEEVTHFNQLTLGGNKRRGFISETPGRDGIELTREGKHALRAFENGQYLRQVASTHFSSFLNLKDYEEVSARPIAIRKPAATTTVRHFFQKGRRRA